MQSFFTADYRPKAVVVDLISVNYSGTFCIQVAVIINIINYVKVQCRVRHQIAVVNNVFRINDGRLSGNVTPGIILHIVIRRNGQGFLRRVILTVTHIFTFQREILISTDGVVII
ncbi:hypothetical protein D3C75_719150 [compost metagenome]